MSSEVVVRAKIAHNVPGRLRLQLERGADIEDAARRLESRVAKMPGVQSVQVHSSTRSVLINYSPTETELARLLGEGNEEIFHQTPIEKRADATELAHFEKANLTELEHGLRSRRHESIFGVAIDEHLHRRANERLFRCFGSGK